MMFLIRNLIILGTLAFLAFISMRAEQDHRLNWAMFYSFLYTAVSLAIVNKICIAKGLWLFPDAIFTVLQIPFDIYFVWLIIWSILPMYLFKGKGLLVITLAFLILDIVGMPMLEKVGLLSLNDGWWLGELCLLVLVFMPGYWWGKLSYKKKRVGHRALFQVVTIIGIFIICLPYLFANYRYQFSVNYGFSPWLFQLLLIFGFPGLVATYDLVRKGGGTPFPYDPTSSLVRTGVYAYIRNPIQWSFTLIFIPLSIYHHDPWLLLGSLFSIVYVFGVSEHQEYPDMEKRFGTSWALYKKSVPKWYFQWRPKNIPAGKIYFDPNCKPCHQFKKWFAQSKATNLEVLNSTEFPGKGLLQVTYVDHRGVASQSVKAVAHAFDHLHLGYATLGWFMRFPVISYLLQAIVNAMGFDGPVEECEV